MAVMEVNDSTFMAQVRNSDVPVLVDFYATWCGPCQMLAPVIEEIARESDGSYKVCKVDVDQAPGLVQQFRIMSVPTLAVIVNGQEARRMVGGRARSRSSPPSGRAQRTQRNKAGAAPAFAGAALLRRRKLTGWRRR